MPIREPAQSAALNTLSDFTTGIDERDELIAQAVAYRILGYSMETIADALCVKAQAVRHFLAEARERGQAQASIARLLDDHALPLAADNLIAGLQEKDKDYTLATLKGRGAFSAHSKQDTTATLTKLEVQVSMPAHAAHPETLEGQIVGVPRKELADA